MRVTSMIKGVMTCGRVSLLAQEAVEARDASPRAVYKCLSDTEVVSTQPMCCDRLSQSGGSRNASAGA